MDLLILFAWSFAAATILPLASELALVGVVRHRQEWMLAVVIASTGNYLGSCTTYWLARAVAARIAAPSPRYERAARLVARYGQPALLLSWVPLIGDAIVAAAGAARMPFAGFSLWTVVGKLARYVVVAWAASRAF
ncbi:MAG: DedA family protein [Acidobacteria bacterium]|nr:DedA family protein [Acidobacteriota bacterium]